MPEKRFHIPKDQIRPIVKMCGGCSASDRILVDGAPVGYMYREAPESPEDSGWCFMAGDESEDYCSDSARWGRYDVNTIANFDIHVVPFLDQPPGSAYVRNPQGKLERSGESSVPERDVFTIPDAEGDADLNECWSAHFAERFRRRIEKEMMMIVRPGLTFWMDGYDTHEETSASVRAKLEAELPPGARDLVREQDAESWRTYFRIESSVKDGRRPALMAQIWSRGHLLHVTADFDDEADLATATAVIRSIRGRTN